MKKIVFLIAVLIFTISCYSMASCNEVPPKNEESTESEELVRAKLALSTEMETYSPLCDGKILPYHSHTYFTVKETADGGHLFSGKIYFADQYGNTYSANYDAFVGNGSWFPEIKISDITPNT